MSQSKHNPQSERGYTVVRAGWPVGPWDFETDRTAWKDEATGLDCLIVRSTIGALCGYVGIGPDHPWHGLNWSDIEDRYGVDVHGGLTFTAAGDDLIRDARMWWIGFDCGHCMDATPGLLAVGLCAVDSTAYRDMEFVKAETAKLAGQIAAGKAPDR